MLANVVVYGFTTARTHGHEELYELFRRWGFTPADRDPVTAWTAMFLHDGFVHLIGNMLFLWVFGRSVEWCLGHVGFVIAYLVTGLAGSAAFYLAAPDLAVPAIGASGAVSGVLGIYLIAFPSNRIRVIAWIFFPIVMSWPAWLLIAFWFVWKDLLPVLGDDADGVGHWAHLGGFAAGALLGLFLRRRALAQEAEASATSPVPAREGWERWLKK